MPRLIPLLAFLALAACGPRTLRVVMEVQNNSGQSGHADLIDHGDSVEINVYLTKSLVDAVQPCHVHTQRCGEIGPAVYGLQNVAVDGGATEAASLNPRVVGPEPEKHVLTFDELVDGNHLINVHDATDKSLYVSCANIN